MHKKRTRQIKDTGLAVIQIFGCEKPVLHQGKFTLPGSSNKRKFEVSAANVSKSMSF